VHIRDDRGVSNFHADLVFVDDGLALVNYSTTNPTTVNGIPVKDRRLVTEGDEIRLADQLVLRLEGPGAAAAEPDSASLLRHLEERLVLDLDIEKRFSVEGSFLDVDVADSYGMKACSTRTDHIIVSFVRWREWVSLIIREFGGTSLNSNGDELMCYFEVPMNAVKSASAILRRLTSFNATENLLSSPFRLRIGVHTGDALVDFERGYAYSPILDVAGHLQKDADVDGLLISEDTLRALPGKVSFAPAGKLEREGISTFRLTGTVE
jgi:hypothetical protein